MRNWALAVVLIAVPMPVLGQDAGPATDPAAICDLAFRDVHDGRYDEARDHASEGVRALRPRTDAASLRLLGACLYNAGRAYEGLGDTASAVRHYAESLEVRPNATVSARLATLVPDVPPTVPLAAIASLELVDGDRLTLDDAMPASARLRDHTRIGLATLTGLNLQRVYAAARVCGTPVVVRLDQVSGGVLGPGYLGARTARARQLGDIDAIVVEMEGYSEDNHGEEFPYRSTAVVFVDACTLRVALFPTFRWTSSDQLRLRFDGSGNAITSHPGPQTPASDIGTFRIRDVAR